MKTEQVNLRLEANLLAALEEAAREESVERAVMIRKLLLTGLSQRRLDRALERYQRGEISIGRAAEDAGVNHWDIMEHAERRGIAYGMGLAEAETQLEILPRNHSRVAEAAPKYSTSRLSGATLPDRPPRPGGVLMIGINPALVSALAGHYYQGRLGKRLWRRLERLGLVTNPTPGAEDDAFVQEGHGLTDVVKRPTRSASELSREEIRLGVEALRQRVLAWRPGLVLFPFQEAARAVVGARFAPGKGPYFNGVRTFLLTGPYAHRDETERTDEELRVLLAALPDRETKDEALSQRITEKDIAKGIVRVPRDARRFFPRSQSSVSIVLRGKRLTAEYRPRLGPDRKRSGVIRVGPVLSRLVKSNERLRISRGQEGSPRLD